ncbi:hypothetical protein ACFRKE_09935 [Kitasatospora indigofera]|uniref:hypothetical protein n=1 Tax=Kitasatospora indigofera TaxID=67307 RepID=UPI0036B0D9E6
MTTSTAIPTAQQRHRRTRTTNVSSQPPLLVSQLTLTSVELTHRAEHLACPVCKTWCPLTLNKGSREWKLVPHHTAKAGTPGARRCSNSNRLVVIDIPLARWQEQRVEASADVAARRPTKVLKKVKSPVAPAITQLTPAAPTADTAHAVYVGHRSRCAACTDPKKRCTDGLLLGATYLEALTQEEQAHTERAVADRVRTEREQRDEDSIQAHEQLQRRQALWAERYPAAEQAALECRVERLAGHADTRRRLFGPQLPFKGYTTQEESLALASRRTEAAIRQTSPIRKND